MPGNRKIKSVAVIGAGASGAITVAALKAEQAFDRIRVFERRQAPGGMWLYDASTKPSLVVPPGSIAPETDMPLEIPEHLPCVTSPNKQERFSETPLYGSLMTNTPSVIMCYSDVPFPHGPSIPFVPHHIARQYVEGYFSVHHTDSLLVLNTTVEDLSQICSPEGQKQWKLTLRKHEPVQDVDIWWEEVYDAVVIANGHYSIPHIPHVKGLTEYIERFPGRVIHSKSYRKPHIFTSKRVLVVGGGISATEIAKDLLPVAHLPIYQSKRSFPKSGIIMEIGGVERRNIITEYLPDGRILLEDGKYLDDIDVVIYCTGYQPSYPFWNNKANGGPLWDYEKERLVKTYLHTFFQDFPNLGIVGIQRTITFRSFEYQAVALARLFAGRNAVAFPTPEEQEEWEKKTEEESETNSRTFHTLGVEDGGRRRWMEALYKFAGPCTLSGRGRNPPVFGEKEQEVVMKQKRADLLAERRILLGQPKDGSIKVGETTYELLGFI